MNKQEIRALLQQAESDCSAVFAKLDQNELVQTQHVLNAFHEVYLEDKETKI